MGPIWQCALSLFRGSTHQQSNADCLHIRRSLCVRPWFLRALSPLHTVFGRSYGRGGVPGLSCRHELSPRLHAGTRATVRTCAQPKCTRRHAPLLGRRGSTGCGQVASMPVMLSGICLENLSTKFSATARLCLVNFDAQHADGHTPAHARTLAHTHARTERDTHTCTHTHK